MKDIRVVFVDDCQTDVHFGVMSLRRAGFDPDVRVVRDHRSLVHQLIERSPELIVSEISLPKLSGLAAFDIVQQRSPQVPFIFRSQSGRSAAVQRAIDRGAIAHVGKNNDELFGAIVCAVLRTRAPRG